MSIRSTLVSVAIAMLACGVTVLASAQVQKDWRKEGPCTEDVKKFCARVKQGEGRIAACMAEHYRDLRPACQGALETARAKVAGMMKACKPDADKYCKGIRPREGRILSCLKGRESDLSPECSAEFKRLGTEP